MLQNNINENTGYFPFTPIFNDFIDNYVKNSNSSFVIVYIYLLKESFINNTVNINFVAEKLQILQADVLTALNFWKEKEIIDYHIDEENLIKIKFLPCKEKIKSYDYKDNDKSKEKSNQKHIYTSEEIDELYAQEEIKQLFKMAERIFGKTFNYTERQTILGLHTELDLPMDVLATLFTYCATNGKTKARYIEKVATDWAEQGINSVSEAEQYLKTNNIYRQILEAFGFKNREPIEREIEKMKPWVLELKMPIELIKEACSRAVMKVKKNSSEDLLRYANKLITEWYKQGVKNLDDIKRLDSEFDKNRNKDNTSYTSTAKQTRYSKFINYEQPKYDFDKMREMEIKRLKERAGEQC